MWTQRAVQVKLLTILTVEVMPLVIPTQLDAAKVNVHGTNESTSLGMCRREQHDLESSAEQHMIASI